jgi:hypothetical protein
MRIRRNSQKRVTRPERKNLFAAWRGAAAGAFPGGTEEINKWTRSMRGPREDEKRDSGD